MVSVAVAPQVSFFPETGLSLPANEVHVWRMELDLPVRRLLHLARSLSPAELDRAARFRSLYDRNCYIARRGILRQICGAYLATEPAAITFDQGPWGRPRLSQKCDGNGLRFSLSHSHMVALYAFTRGREVGVDIERIRSDMAWQPLAPLCLSARERALLRALPETARTEAFFTLWARKEAYLKARGVGLSVRLNQIDVVGRGTYGGVLARIGARWQEPWSGCLQDLDAGRHDVAALAVEAPGLTVVCREWY
ncbi:MAG TPA: 4'-phosphopantetheinyl transferase superfamily protein [Sedimentisphaerales bacterium]|nr:4'-phosphopantetheinyl transferase superfamily protein [Sedimentisphaerales bacterium]HRS10241.1 4'-phosphopantetheinyl transferase superfamily protein [Sedimentisphaerales bacterium]HRV46947.1 4'-phosphopantetheinyl transferase superfamily protein [Sedimentisphaerales bacterium]